MLSENKFKPYRLVFQRFGFGLRLEAIILSQIYPLQTFLGEDGKPIVEFHTGRNSKKPSKRRLSLRKFQKMLGLAPVQESSGDKKKSKVAGGSDLCRIAFWQWVFTKIEPKRQRLKNEIGEKLGEKLDAEKAAGRPVKLVRSRVAVAGVKMLFSELVKEICQNDQRDKQN